jgi:hypothetical protein
MNRDQILLLSKFEDQILDLIENKDEFTQSDLQGVVQALVLNIYQVGKSA